MRVIEVRITGVDSEVRINIDSNFLCQYELEAFFRSGELELEEEILFASVEGGDEDIRILIDHNVFNLY